MPIDFDINTLVEEIQCDVLEHIKLHPKNEQQSSMVAFSIANSSTKPEELGVILDDLETVDKVASSGDCPNNLKWRKVGSLKLFKQLLAEGLPAYVYFGDVVEGKKNISVQLAKLYIQAAKAHKLDHLPSYTISSRVKTRQTELELILLSYT